MPQRDSSAASTAQEDQMIIEDALEKPPKDKAPLRRRSNRTPKPIVKLNLKDASNSEGSDEDSGDDSSKRSTRFAAKAVPSRGGVKGNVKEKGPNKTKRSRNDDDDCDFSGSEDVDILSMFQVRKKDGNSLAVEDNDPTWTEPDYTDQAWFKKNCLICQICKKSYELPVNALNCFHSHDNQDDHLRCYVCFAIFKGGKVGTRRLFRHYQKRHQEGDKGNTVKCPHCYESLAYRSVSCHIIAVHFREVLGIPFKKVAALKKNGTAGLDEHGE